MSGAVAYALSAWANPLRIVAFLLVFVGIVQAAQGSVGVGWKTSKKSTASPFLFIASYERLKIPPVSVLILFS